jgi:hypothetical protein
VQAKVDAAAAEAAAEHQAQRDEQLDDRRSAEACGGDREHARVGVGAHLRGRVRVENE